MQLNDPSTWPTKPDKPGEYWRSKYGMLPDRVLVLNPSEWGGGGSRYWFIAPLPAEAPESKPPVVKKSLGELLTDIGINGPDWSCSYKNSATKKERDAIGVAFLTAAIENGYAASVERYSEINKICHDVDDANMKLCEEIKQLRAELSAIQEVVDGKRPTLLGDGHLAQVREILAGKEQSR